MNQIEEGLAYLSSPFGDFDIDVYSRGIYSYLLRYVKRDGSYLVNLECKPTKKGICEELKVSTLRFNRFINIANKNDFAIINKGDNGLEIRINPYYYINTHLIHKNTMEIFDISEEDLSLIEDNLEIVFDIIES